MNTTATWFPLLSLPLFALAAGESTDRSGILVITETYAVDNHGLKDNNGNRIDLSQYKEVHLNGSRATIEAGGNSPRLIGHPDGTTIKAVGKVKGGKMYFQDGAVDAHIENIVIDGNRRAWDSPRGMWITGGHGTTIINCTIENVSHSGLTVLGGHHSLLVRDCTFRNISWPEMPIAAVQGVQEEFKISASTGDVQEGWLKRPTNAQMERWLTDRWTAQDTGKHGRKGYSKQLLPMDVGYLHGIYLTGGQHDVLIENCTFRDINWGFGINITGGSYNVTVRNCRFRDMGKGCFYVGGSDRIDVTGFDAVRCATLLHLYRHAGGGRITFANGKGADLGYYAFYVLDYHGKVNLNILNNDIDGCGRAFMGCTGGSGFKIGGNTIRNLRGNEVWEHLLNTRDNSHGAIADVDFHGNSVSFERKGVSFFGSSSAKTSRASTELGSNVTIRNNTFRNVTRRSWSYRGIAGPEPVSRDNSME